MSIAITLREYLADHDTHYEEVPHRPTGSTLETSEVAHISGDKMVKPVLLGDADCYFLALIPATRRLEIDTLNERLGRHLALMPEIEVARAFADCELGSIPPVGGAYGIETWADASLIDQPDLYFESGDHKLLLHIYADDFKSLFDETLPAEICPHI